MPAFVGVQVDTVALVLSCEGGCAAVVAIEVMPDVDDGQAQAALMLAADLLRWDVRSQHCPACRTQPEAPVLAWSGTEGQEDREP